MFLLDQHIHDSTHPGPVAVGGDRLLQGHQPVLALQGYLGRDLICQGRRRGALLRGEGKHPHMVETMFGNEVQQMLEMGFGFTREADDEGGAQHGLRELLPDAPQQSIGDLRLPGAIHGP